MILTHDRLDCLRLCMEMLERSDAFGVFDKVVMLLNGVSRRHAQYVHRFMQKHPKVSWDTVIGPGTRPDGISFVQNECIRRYPDSIYVKIDNDIFVHKSWARTLLEAYEVHKKDDRLGLISPLIPNNAMGLCTLLNRFYPNLLAEYVHKFGSEPESRCQGAVWSHADIAIWATRKFIDIEEANRVQKSIVAGGERYVPFTERFSIGCIIYDYKLWQKMGGIPRTDEPGWCAWVEENGHHHVLDASQIVLHYSFFIQQDWMDRSPILEDIRRINLPETLSSKLSPRYIMPRLIRTAMQIPRVIPRKAGSLIKRECIQ
ncbi:MAG: hypothetical protein AB7T27_10855 [Kiritimatiellia bacterium]